MTPAFIENDYHYQLYTIPGSKATLFAFENMAFPIFWRMNWPEGIALPKPCNPMHFCGKNTMRSSK
jgi:hypothetical protein